MKKAEEEVNTRGKRFVRDFYGILCDRCLFPLHFSLDLVTSANDFEH